jgi:hypothetical protein
MSHTTLNKNTYFDNSKRTNQTLHISEVMQLMPLFNPKIKNESIKK